MIDLADEADGEVEIVGIDPTDRGEADLEPLQLGRDVLHLEGDEESRHRRASGEDR